jgi:putative peptidoglycan lipid II flippase
VYAAPITDLLLVRGAFNADNAITVARTVSALALAIPSYTCVVLLLRLALALHLNLAIAFISAVNLALNIALNAWLSSVLGVAGIALSTSAVYALSFGLLYAVTQQRISSRLATGVRARGVQG